MGVSTTVWVLTALITTGVLLVDVFVIGRHPHEPTMKESGRALAFFVGLAVLFGIGVWFFYGARYGGEFFAGWLTEYSLSIDNLFIFIIIMSKFAVPRELQQTALLVGIVLALVLRAVFIAVGAAAINEFSWVFYLFGLFLIWTAVNLAREGNEDDAQYDEPRMVAFDPQALPCHSGVARRQALRPRGRQADDDPDVLVVLALGITDLLFALDSIPAIYGLTSEPYLVFTANVFALMGLRQLYFLIGGLLERLVYLSYGLAFLLLFIGVKLILHALHENELPFVNGGHGAHRLGPGDPDLALARGHHRHAWPSPPSPAWPRSAPTTASPPEPTLVPRAAAGA